MTTYSLRRTPDMDPEDSPTALVAWKIAREILEGSWLNLDPSYEQDLRAAVTDAVQRVRESIYRDRAWRGSGEITLTQLDPEQVFQRGDYRYHSGELAEIVRSGLDLVPIVAGVHAGGAHVLDGHHRLRAYALAGQVVPALLVSARTDGEPATIEFSIRPEAPARQIRRVD